MVCKDKANEKPTLIVMPNLSWDLAARDKQLFYNDMFDWIEDTIKWFVENNKYNLIIKPHPSEDFKGIPKTFDTVKAFIDKSFKKLPSNVYLLPATNNVEVSKLNLHGILSWTSTSSVEYLALGFVSVTLAKGPIFGLNICIEPKSRQSYHYLMHSLLNSHQTPHADQVASAMRFLYMQNFCYYIKHSLFSCTNFSQLSLYVRSLNDLMSGNYPEFEYIANQIMSKNLIISLTLSLEKQMKNKILLLLQYSAILLEVVLKECT